MQNDSELPARPVKASSSEYTELALPNDANPLGNLIGGRILHLVDITGAIAAMRHARIPVVTASIDHMTFLHPVHIGELVILKSMVNRVFKTSMEVGVKVFVENMATGVARHTASAYLTFVGIDAKGARVTLPQAYPESEDEIRRFNAAGDRRKYRLELKAK